MKIKRRLPTRRQVGQAIGIRHNNNNNNNNNENNTDFNNNNNIRRVPVVTGRRRCLSSYSNNKLERFRFLICILLCLICILCIISFTVWIGGMQTQTQTQTQMQMQMKEKQQQQLRSSSSFNFNNSNNKMAMVTMGEERKKKQSLSNDVATAVGVVVDGTTTVEQQDNDNDNDNDMQEKIKIKPKSKYCNNYNLFIKNCGYPQPTTCKKEIIKRFSTHGIGNALMVSYSREAESIYYPQPKQQHNNNNNNNNDNNNDKEESESCIPILIDSDPTNDPFKFKLLNYVQIPNGTLQLPAPPVANTHQNQKLKQQKCIMYSITQPLPKIQMEIDKLLIPDEQHIPLVSLHIRTGWADEMLRRKTQLWDKLNNQICSSNKGIFDYVNGNDGTTTRNNSSSSSNTSTSTTTTTTNTDSNSNSNSFSLLADSLGDAIYDTKKQEFKLDHMLDSLRDKANSKFGGPKKWRFFIASDSPFVKIYSSNYLKGSYYTSSSSSSSSNEGGGHAIMTTGLIGHNLDRSNIQQHTVEENDSIYTNVWLDLLIMSESSIFGQISSKYPDVARIRNFCLSSSNNPAKDTIINGAMPRHDLADIANVGLKFVSYLFGSDSSSSGGDGDNNHRYNNNNNSNSNNKNGGNQGKSKSIDPRQHKDYNTWLNKLKEHLPIQSRKCLNSSKPILACLCWIKRAHA